IDSTARRWNGFRTNPLKVSTVMRPHPPGRGQGRGAGRPFKGRLGRRGGRALERSPAMRGKPRAAPGSALRRVLLGGAVALLAAFYLARAATEAARASPTFFVDPSRVAVEEVPAWLPPEWIEEAKAALRGVRPFSIFDARGTEEAVAGLRPLGW